MENHWVAPLAGAALALAGLFGIAWRFRARAVRRRLTALAAYAEREIARERRRRAVRRAQPFSAALGVSGAVRASPASHGQLWNTGKVH
jgi:hypothetical protein